MASSLERRIGNQETTGPKQELLKQLGELSMERDSSKIRAVPNTPRLQGSVADSTPAFTAQPPFRTRMADHVFESMVRAILSGELKPGRPIPTQRDLARQFNVSSLVVRQAIHRLEDLGLVRVRQGSATIALDPAESTDVRLLQLQMELAQPGGALSASALENQTLFVVPLLVLAERRITDQEVGVLHYLVEHVSGRPSTEEARRFRVEYWREIAKATRNPLFQQQIRWLAAVASDLDRRGIIRRISFGRLDMGMYGRLTAALAARKGAVQLYLEWATPLVEWMDKNTVRSGGALAHEGNGSTLHEPEGSSSGDQPDARGV